MGQKYVGVNAVQRVKNVFLHSARSFEQFSRYKAQWWTRRSFAVGENIWLRWTECCPHELYENGMLRVNL